MYYFPPHFICHNKAPRCIYLPRRWQGTILPCVWKVDTTSNKSTCAWKKERTHICNQIRVWPPLLPWGAFSGVAAFNGRTKRQLLFGAENLLFENQKIPTFLPITFSVFSATRLKLPAIVLCKQCKRCSFSEWIDQSNYHSIILPVSSNNTFPLPVIPPFNHLLCSLSTLKKCLEILLDAVAAFWLSELNLNQFSRAWDEQTSCL